MLRFPALLHYFPQSSCFLRIQRETKACTLKHTLPSCSLKAILKAALIQVKTQRDAIIKISFYMPFVIFNRVSWCRSPLPSHFFKGLFTCWFTEPALNILTFWMNKYTSWYNEGVIPWRRQWDKQIPLSWPFEWILRSMLSDAHRCFQQCVCCRSDHALIL